jgi:hypothetical protein
MTRSDSLALPVPSAHPRIHDWYLYPRSQIDGDTSKHLRKQTSWVHSEYMVLQGTIGRFVRWGVTHGPAWGVFAAVIAGIPLAIVGDATVSEVQIVLGGLLAGALAGPLLGLAAGIACLGAELVPKWILDAPDYVAVAAVAGIVGGIAWPVLELGRSGPAAGIMAVALITSVPAIDAARSAPRLLHSDGPDAVPAAGIDVPARGQAS